MDLGPAGRSKRPSQQKTLELRSTLDVSRLTTGPKGRLQKTFSLTLTHFFMIFISMLVNCGEKMDHKQFLEISEWNFPVQCCIDKISSRLTVKITREFQRYKKRPRSGFTCNYGQIWPNDRQFWKLFWLAQFYWENGAKSRLSNEIIYSQFQCFRNK